MQRVSAEDVVRERLDTVPTPAAEDLASARDALGDAEARRVRGPVGGRPAHRARLRTARARRADGAVPARARGRARARDAAAAHGRASSSTHERALEGDEVGARVVLAGADAGRPARPLRAPARRRRGRARAEPGRPAPRGRASGASSSSRCAPRAGAGTCSARPTLRARDPLGFLAWESTADTRPELRVYPREEVLRRVLAPRETQVFARQRGRAREGRGDRVRRHPAAGRRATR